jgi:hypothetical protein
MTCFLPPAVLPAKTGKVAASGGKFYLSPPLQLPKQRIIIIAASVFSRSFCRLVQKRSLFPRPHPRSGVLSNFPNTNRFPRFSAADMSELTHPTIKGM